MDSRKKKTKSHIFEKEKITNLMPDSKIMC